MWQVNSGETTNTTSKFEAENNSPPPKKNGRTKEPKNRSCKPNARCHPLPVFASISDKVFTFRRLGVTSCGGTLPTWGARWERVGDAEEGARRTFA